MVPYEQRLRANLNWGFMEGSLHFELQSSVHKTLRKLVRHLDAHGIPYAILGDMAMFFHGYRRFTEVVELLVTREGLDEALGLLEALGYVTSAAGSKQLRDAEYGVRITFRVTGEYPGDGKPKAMAFPDPRECGIEIGGLHCIKLPRLIELKLASAIANPRLLGDFADVQELLKALYLPEEYTERLQPFARDAFNKLWTAVATMPPDAPG